MHDRRDASDDPLALHRRDAEAGRLEVGRHRAHAPAVRTPARSDERLEQLVDPRLGGAVVGRAHERHDVAVGLLEHAREQLHPDEAGGPGEQQRTRVGGDGGHAASRHNEALWPPKPNEFDSATGGRPLDISIGRAVPGT